MCETGTEKVTDKKIDVYKASKSLEKVLSIINTERKTFLKNFTTKELIQELKRRGINMPKKYR